MLSNEGWGGVRSCKHCGHPASYHGITFCMVTAGAENKRLCDCSGWESRAPIQCCGCTADTELAAGPACTVCGHRDHGKEGCQYAIR